MFQFNPSPFIQPWESASVHLNWLFLKVMGEVIVFSLSKDAASSLIYCAYAKKEELRLNQVLEVPRKESAIQVRFGTSTF